MRRYWSGVGVGKGGQEPGLTRIATMKMIKHQI